MFTLLNLTVFTFYGMLAVAISPNVQVLANLSGLSHSCCANHMQRLRVCAREHEGTTACLWLRVQVSAILSSLFYSGWFLLAGFILPRPVRATTCLVPPRCLKQ